MEFYVSLGVLPKCFSTLGRRKRKIFVGRPIPWVLSNYEEGQTRDTETQIKDNDTRDRVVTIKQGPTVKGVVRFLVGVTLRSLYGRVGPTVGQESLDPISGYPMEEVRKSKTIRGGGEKKRGLGSPSVTRDFED